MPKNVLVPVDGSERSLAGLEYCFASFPHATITALYVIDPEHDDYRSIGKTEPREETERKTAERILERARARAEERGHEIRTEVERGIPHRKILEFATEDDIDHITLGSHGESPITRPFLGHVSETILRRAPVSTTVVPESTDGIVDRELPGRILVPVDGSEQAAAALTYAIEEFPDAEITALHVIDLPFEYSHEEIEGTYVESMLDVLEERATGILESATTQADEHDVSIGTATEYGKPAQSIVEFAEENEFDQIVMGVHGRSLAARLVTGSVAERVARRSPISVTLVRGSPHGT